MTHEEMLAKAKVFNAFFKDTQKNELKITKVQFDKMLRAEKDELLLTALQHLGVVEK